MRRLLILLVLANALAYVWWRGYLDEYLGSPREPDRVARQVGDDRLRIVPLKPADPAKPAATSAAAGGAPAAAPVTEVCVETGPLEDARAVRIREFLITAGGTVRGIPDVIDNVGVWMVYTGPADSLSSAQRRVTDLQRLNVKDFYLIQDGSYRNAISFGLFRSEEGARALADNLAKQGVRGARVVQRSANETKTVFSLRYGSDLATAAPAVNERLSALTTELGINPVTCHGKP